LSADEPEGLDGRWTNSSGECLTIRAGQIIWEDGPTARLVRRGKGEFAISLDGTDEFCCRCSAEGHLTWNDGDVWRRSGAVPPATVPSPPQHLRRESAAEASRRRIASAGGEWHSVLDVEPSASVEDVKRAFHELALLHHPDKGLVDGDAATFRAVQRAYEEGLREVELASAAERAPAVAVARPREGLLVALNAPKRELREAMDHWENCLDDGTADHVPDDIEQLPLEEAVRLLREGSCVPVDVRQPEEKYGALIKPLPGAAQLSYLGVLKSPETVVRQVAELHRRTNGGADGRQILCYSTHGGTSGNCAVVACALMDVFGFKGEAVRTLENGYLGWKRWREQNKELVDSLPVPA